MITAIFIAALLLLLCTTIHYLTLRSVSHAIERRPAERYVGPTLSVAAITIAYVIEALLYAGGFWLGDAVVSIGSFQQNAAMS